MHCRNFLKTPLSRREMLQRGAMGFGGVALHALMNSNDAVASLSNPLGAKTPHHGPKVKNVIFLYMDGGPSQVDTFDYKPLLEKYHGQDPREVIGKLAPTQFDNVGTVLKGQWQFKQHGESGNWVSELFPYLSQKHVIDELAFVKSMTSRFSEHTFANYFLHTGSGFQGRPSMGAWTSYGLGTENENLPGFVVLNGGLIPPGGLDCFGSGFLPASYQGSVFLPKDQPIANIRRQEATIDQQKRKLDLLGEFDRERNSSDLAIEAAIQNYETAFKMQSAVPDLMDLRGESGVVKGLYGLNDEFAPTQTFGLQCLIARRLVERGVRFVELTCPKVTGDRWDQHGKLHQGHTNNCKAVDQPIAALITDLKMLGLLDSTLLVWAGEFGRTPFAQGRDGRDHNPSGFTIWMAGGGIKEGASIGETDDFGYRAVRDRFEIHDLHATMLHLLGVDHTRSTFRFSGRDMRLTDVHGHLMEGILS